MENILPLLSTKGHIVSGDSQMTEHGRYIYGIMWPTEKEGDSRKKGGSKVSDNAAKFWGIVLFIVGIVFLLSNYALIPETLSKLWPVVLLGVGLKMFFTEKRQVSGA
jgi:hypothetical protein